MNQNIVEHKNIKAETIDRVMVTMTLKVFCMSIVVLLLTFQLIISAASQEVDVNDDGEVDILDIAIAANSFGSYPGHPRWNPIADVNEDNVVDLFDIVLIAKSFT